jgi:hypothetical protein
MLWDVLHSNVTQLSSDAVISIISPSYHREMNFKVQPFVEELLREILHSNVFLLIIYCTFCVIKLPYPDIFASYLFF